MSDTPTTISTEEEPKPKKNWRKAAMWVGVAIATLTTGAVIASKFNKDEGDTLAEIVEDITTE